MADKNKDKRKYLLEKLDYTIVRIMALGVSVDDKVFLREAQEKLRILQKRNPIVY